MAKVNKTCHPAKRRGELLERDAPARQKRCTRKLYHGKTAAVIRKNKRK